MAPLGSRIDSMPKLRSQVVKVLPERIDASSEYAVLYVRASDNFDAIDEANIWARANGMVRARELTLTKARIDGDEFFVARCYRLAPGER